MSQLESGGRETVIAHNVTYVDFRPIIEPFFLSGLCADDKGCGDGHIGAIFENYSGGRTKAISSISSSWIAHAMCEELRAGTQ